ncbi:MAG: glycosyltransferase family 4 protein [Planctomycetes bacterium]|nr:glycosyltransferase family 4 protein [Planctomycetota bacterium]
MGLLDTMIHGKTAFLAGIAQEIRLRETILADQEGRGAGRRVVFQDPRVVDYRASVDDIAAYLVDLMENAALRRQMGEAGRKRVVETYDYRVVAEQFARTVAEKLGLA